MDAIEPKLAFQNSHSIHEKLSLANKKLEFQFVEIEKIAAELISVNKKLAFRNKENDKRNAELIIANKELIFQNEEKEKRANELIIANKELKRADEYQLEYITGLEQMMFITSHKMRMPVANIIGLSNLLEDLDNYPEDLPLYLEYIKQSAESLDGFTKELTTFIFNLGQKGKL